jgi:transcriptional regulator with XRE-family HTH domain
MVRSVNENEALLVAAARRAAEDGSARQIRLAAGLSQAEVALVCHVTAQAVTRWESTDPERRRSPKGEPAVRYARLLDRLKRSPSVVTLLGEAA